MMMNTSRFGQVEVEDERIITFASGILGFPNAKRFILLQPSEDSEFCWLQAVNRPELAFVVTDPSMFVSSYRVPIKVEQMRELGLTSLADAQVFVIVNKRETTLTGNLQGPLVINVKQHVGEQLVLSDRRFTTGVPLVELNRPLEAVPA